MNESNVPLRVRLAREAAHRGWDPAAVRTNTLRRMSGWPAKDAPLPSDPCRDPQCAACSSEPKPWTDHLRRTILDGSEPDTARLHEENRP